MAQWTLDWTRNERPSYTALFAIIDWFVAGGIVDDVVRVFSSE